MPTSRGCSGARFCCQLQNRLPIPVNVTSKVSLHVLDKVTQSGLRTSGEPKGTEYLGGGYGVAFALGIQKEVPGA